MHRRRIAHRHNLQVSLSIHAEVWNIDFSDGPAKNIRNIMVDARPLHFQPVHPQHVECASSILADRRGLAHESKPLKISFDLLRG